MAPHFVTLIANDMGPQPFLAFLRDYYQTHKWQTATASAFQELVQSRCRCRQQSFFQSWLYEDAMKVDERRDS